MVRRAKCSDPLHDSPARRAAPGWQDIIGLRLDRTGTEADPPITQDGMLCGACAAIRETTILAELTGVRTRYQSMITKLTALGFSPEEIQLMNLTYDIRNPGIVPSVVAGSEEGTRAGTVATMMATVTPTAPETVEATESSEPKPTSWLGRLFGR